MKAKESFAAGSSISTLAIDIGGTGIKSMLLDASGNALDEPILLLTPHPATPHAVLKVISALAKKHSGFDRVSVGFPGVVRKGTIETAPNLHHSWEGVALDRVLSQNLSVPVRVAND